MTTQLIICLLIFAATLVSFIAGKFSMATTAVISMLLLVLTGCTDPETALSGFSNSNTIIMATMFVVSAGFSRTQMVSRMSHLVARISKGSFTKILAGYVLIIAVLTQFIQSSMACFSIVFPLACAICDEMGYSRSKMIFPIGIVSISTVSILPFGNSAVMYLTNNGYLESYHYTAYLFKMLDPMIARLPGMILIILYAIFFAPRLAPEKPVLEISTVESKFSAGDGRLSPLQEILGYVSFFGIVIMLLTQPLHNIPSWEITTIGAVIMVASGILRPRDAYQAMGLGGMVLLYAGMLALGSALTTTGAGSLVGNFLAGMVGNSRNNYVIGLLFFITPFILTQFMMNVAVVNIFIPIAIITSKSLACNPLGLIMLVWIASLTAFMTPMATPTVSMVMGLGGYDQKTMLKMSWLPAILMCVVNVFWVMTVFPAF
ncbi:MULTISPECIES: SLC13 family permease [Acutalibacteraceae]|uniref:SLC13 family permease n=1 Tax=Acutalibacteraceae TaxID=3082771 RepID=UPI0013E8D2EC|nr:MULTISPECIES: SLC13 family permease [Acutalibacteraceae]